MASNFIGAIVGADGTIHAIVNPDNDSELDNPRLLLLRTQEKAQGISMVKITRGEYMGALSMKDVAAIVQRLKK